MDIEIFIGKVLNASKTSLLVAGILVFLAACEKPDHGDYDFQNKVNVYEGSTYDYLLSQKGVYDSLLKVLDRVGWAKEALILERSEADKNTFFAPTNASFQLALDNLNTVRTRQNKKKLSLDDVPEHELDSMINRYIIKGYYDTNSFLLTDGVILNTLRYTRFMHGEEKRTNASGLVNGGPKSVIYSDTKNSIYIRDWQSSGTQAVNILTANGVVHVLLDSHEFGFAEFIARVNKD